MEVCGVWLPAIGYRTPQTITYEHFSVYYKLAETYGEITIVETVSDVENVIKSEGRIGFLLHLEGAEPIDDSYDLLLLKKLGLRSIGPTWNYENKYACSCSAKKDYGLTALGEELIRTANKLGIIIDLAHASKKTAMEALEVAIVFLPEKL